MLQFDIVIHKVKLSSPYNLFMVLEMLQLSLSVEVTTSDYLSGRVKILEKGKKANIELLSFYSLIF